MEFASAAKNYALASGRLGDVFAEKSEVVNMHDQYKLTIEVSFLYIVACHSHFLTYMYLACSALVDKNFLSQLVGSICRVVVDLSGFVFLYVTDSLRSEICRSLRIIVGCTHARTMHFYDVPRKP